MGGDQPHSESYITHLTHAEVADQLAEYVVEKLTGGTPEARYPQVAAHLARCMFCRAGYAELLALTRATYDCKDELPEQYPAPDLTRLDLAPPAQPEPQRPWQPDPDGSWQITLTPALLKQGRLSPLAGSARAGDLLYDLRIPASAAGGPDLRVEILGDPRGVELGLMIGVDLPGRQGVAGVAVTAAAAGWGEWPTTTDPFGTAIISGIPRPALEGLQIRIRANPAE